MQSDNPRLALHLARKAIREKVATVAANASLPDLRALLNLLVADAALDDPSITVNTAELPADVKKAYEKATKKPKGT